MTTPPSSPRPKRATAFRSVLPVVTASLLAGCSITSVPSDGYHVRPYGKDCLQVERSTTDKPHTALGIYCKQETP